MIIDFHVHIFPDKIAKKAIGNLARISGLTPFTDGTIKDTMDKLKACGVDKAVFLNIATKPSQMTTINDEAARLNSMIRVSLVFFYDMKIEFAP